MAAPLVDWHIGRMPLVITCPHDGRAKPPGVPERRDDQAGCLTKKQADLSTWTIALGLSSAVEALMGLEPSMVVARFHRRYIDANRPAKCAFVAREAFQVQKRRKPCRCHALTVPASRCARPNASRAMTVRATLMVGTASASPLGKDQTTPAATSRFDVLPIFTK